MAQPDELIDFHHLKMRKGLSKVELEDSVASDLARATGLVDAAAAASNRLNKIVQLTGFSDPIYAEAYVTGACMHACMQSGGGGVGGWKRGPDGLCGAALHCTAASWSAAPGGSGKEQEH